jgi:uncharacterized protein (TIGR00288 family)
MASSPDSVSMALFCDFENVALGVRDAKYDKFDIMPVLERLLLKGSIVVKKAYCDWDRYKGFKAAMHEASFELIEIPHVRQSGKNSADIRLVVDALDLCYTKSHVDTFVIISGDSDFSPLVSKLRENAKKVIGVGVKNSTSDLLVANCDEFIFYDDLVREQQRSIAKREAREAREARDARDANAAASSAKRSPDDDRQPKQELEARKAKAIAIAVETFDDLASERGESGKIWASVLKSAIKRRKPDFNESYYGFRAFGNLLEEAQVRGLLEVGRDEKSGSFVFRTQSVAATEPVRDIEAPVVPKENRQAGNAGGSSGSGNDRNRRKGRNPRPQVSEPLFDEPREAQPGTHAEAHSESRDEHDRKDGPNPRSQVAEPLFDEPQTAQQPEPQVEARPRQGRDRNRRNNRNPRPQVHEPLFDVAQEQPPEARAENHAQAADERPFFTLPVKAKEEFVFVERTEETPAQPSEVSKAPSPKPGVARRGRQAAAKKVVTKTQPEAPIESAAAANTIESTDKPAAKKTAAKKAPRKTAPASRRPRKTAAAASEE